MLAEPVGELVFGELSGGKGLHRAHRRFGPEREFDTVEQQKCAREHPCGALVAIGKWVVAGNTEGIGSG